MKTRWTTAARASINATLFHYLRPAMIKYRKNGQALSPWTIDPVYQLPIQQTAIITLPIFPNNEAKVSEITNIVRGITERMAYTPEDVQASKIVFTGDFLTVRNTRYCFCSCQTNSDRLAIARQSYALPHAYLHYIEPVAGLFHFQLQVLTTLYQTHFGTPEELNSISHWMTLLRSNVRIWDVKRKSIKNFRACHSFFNSVLDAHILALYGAEYKTPDCETLLEMPAHHNWRKAVRRISEHVEDTTYIRILRSKPETERDILYENSMLFVQHGLLYREFSNAIAIGDIGAIEYCLSYFAIWLQSTDKFNYAMESAHIVACLRKIWSQDFREFWQDTCLVNSSEKATGYMACDMLCEYLVRELKDLFQHMSTDFLRDVVATQILVFRDIRKNIQRQCHAIDYGQHSTEMNIWQNVRAITSKLLAVHTFQQIPGRGSGPISESPKRKAIDLYDAGLIKLSTGAWLEKYKAKMNRGYLMAGSGIGENIRRVGGLSDSDIESEGGVDEESSDDDEMLDIEEEEDLY